MDEMNITSAKYVTENKIMIFATVDGQEMTVPTDSANTHYAEIMRQVDAGELTIADAD
jgi:hypothetical protein